MDEIREYCIRFNLDLDKTQQDPFIEWIRRYAIDTTLIAVYENPRGVNPHIHAMFKSTSKIKEIRNSLGYTFKNHFKELNDFSISQGEKGGRTYSLTEDTGNVLYLCKGPLAVSKLKDPRYPGEKKDVVVLFNDAVPDEDIWRSHEEWWRQAKNFRVGKVEKEKKMNELEEIIKFVECRALGIDKQMLPDYTQYDLQRDVVKYYIKKRRTIRYPLMNDYVNTIWLILLNTHRKQDFEQALDDVLVQFRAYIEKKY